MRAAKPEDIPVGSDEGVICAHDLSRCTRRAWRAQFRRSLLICARWDLLLVRQCGRSFVWIIPDRSWLAATKLDAAHPMETATSADLPAATSFAPIVPENPTSK